MTPKDNPKILITTTPIRPIPAQFPPLGSLSVISALNKAGFNDTEFYNIDLLRPSYQEVIDHILLTKPDILGISAVVSTAYEYTKKLSLDIKKHLPDTTIVLGGGLGASAEIVLKKTGIDFICTGEGEAAMVDFATRWLIAESKEDYETLKGWSFLRDDQALTVTPYADPIPADDIYDINWSILEDLNQMKYFISSYDTAVEDYNFSRDSRTFESHRREKRLVRIPTTKGCVARCTFCHRWDTGIRFIPVPIVMRRIDYFVEKYNIGFIRVADENFGSNKKWLIEFMAEMKKRNLLWCVGGMRVSTITSEMIGQMKDAGCTSIIYGMESGSSKMLKVMEKVTTVEQNRNAVKWMAEHDMFTIVQLILGMPGETLETISETTEFANYFVEQSPKTDPNSMSINFAQALPGTPLYEIARRGGVIGQSLEDEEGYLLSISDRDARDGETTINFTDYPKLYLEKWRFDICNSVRNAYINKWGKNNYNNITLNSFRYKGIAEKKETDSGYFAEPARSQENSLGLSGEKDIELSSEVVSDTIHDINEKIEISDNQMPSFFTILRKKSISSMATFYPRFFWLTREVTIFYIFLNECRKSGVPYALKLAANAIRWKLNQFKTITDKSNSIPALSLRKMLRKGYPPVIASDNPVMEKLRLGR
jgi:anaerobic magnesium-protoporphyrin IX monomethyl ester cyclase